MEAFGLVMDAVDILFYAAVIVYIARGWKK